jgi:hypothetical protein
MHMHSFKEKAAAGQGTPLFSPVTLKEDLFDQ